jgi:hypothetical protein
MDDGKEKSAIEKMIDKVNDAVENIANTASDARPCRKLNLTSS